MQFILLSTFASVAIAGHVAPLFGRQASTSQAVSCTNGGSVCGNSCYDPQSQLCCSTAGDLCSIGQYCSTDSSGNAACCENGSNCAGTASTNLQSATTAASIASGATGSPSSVAASGTSSGASASTTSVTCSSSESRCGSGCYDPNSYVCCQGGSVCAIGQYCNVNSLQEVSCCATGYNCNGEGSSTTSAQSATSVPAGGTVLASASTTGM